MSVAPAGWYDDGSGQQRWWNGREWSPVSQPTASAPRSKRPKWPWLLGAALLVVVLLIVGGILLIVSLVIGLTTAAGTPSAAVLSLQQAFDDRDCDLLVSVTTQDFREQNDIGDCEAFLSAIDRGDEQGYTDEQFRITGFESRDSDASVFTEESVELDGDRVEFELEYTLHADDGVWRIVAVD